MKPGKPPLQSIRLSDQVRERICCLNYSLNTEKLYVYWIKFFIRWHGMKHPRDNSVVLQQAGILFRRQGRFLGAITWLPSCGNETIRRRMLGLEQFLLRGSFSATAQLIGHVSYCLSPVKVCNSPQPKRANGLSWAPCPNPLSECFNELAFRQTTAMDQDDAITLQENQQLREYWMTLHDVLSDEQREAPTGRRVVTIRGWLTAPKPTQPCPAQSLPCHTAK